MLSDGGSCVVRVLAISGSLRVGSSNTILLRAAAELAPDGLAVAFYEGLLGIPMTAHVLGGCPVGRGADDGVVGLDGQVHEYPGLFVVDGSIVPGNPGVNPSLTIAALAEHVMSLVPPRAPGPAPRARYESLAGRGADNA